MLEVYGFSRVNELARGTTRDLRVLWALEEMGRTRKRRSSEARTSTTSSRCQAAGNEFVISTENRAKLTGQIALGIDGHKGDWMIGRFLEE